MLNVTIERHDHNGVYTITSSVGKRSFYGMNESQAIRVYRIIFRLKEKHMNIIRL